MYNIVVRECLDLLDIHDILSEFNPSYSVYYGLSRAEFVALLFDIIESELNAQCGGSKTVH